VSELKEEDMPMVLSQHPLIPKLKSSELHFG